MDKELSQQAREAMRWLSSNGGMLYIGVLKAQARLPYYELYYAGLISWWTGTAYVNNKKVDLKNRVEINEDGQKWLEENNNE
jgi:hypothetical protein